MLSPYISHQLQARRAVTGTLEVIDDTQDDDTDDETFTVALGCLAVLGEGREPVVCASDDL